MNWYDVCIGKQELYSMVDSRIAGIGIEMDLCNYPLSAYKVAMMVCKNLKISLYNFPTRDVGGMLYRGRHTTSIFLNEKRPDTSRNFDCMHEVIHYWFHPDKQYICRSDFEQNYFEWQANEGAAQALMPYQLFIPEYYKIFRSRKLQRTGAAVEEYLAESFGVSCTAVRFRINSLKDEIKRFKL